MPVNSLEGAFKCLHFPIPFRVLHPPQCAADDFGFISETAAVNLRGHKILEMLGQGNVHEQNISSPAPDGNAPLFSLHFLHSSL